MNDNPLPSIPNVEDHFTPPVQPAPPSPSLPPTGTPPSSGSNQGWNKGKLLAGAIAGLILMVGLGVGVYLNSRQEPTQVDTEASDANECIPPGPNTNPNICDTCGGENQGQCGVGSVSDTCHCGGHCDPGFVENGAGGCSLPAPTAGPGPGGSMNCTTTRDGSQGPPLSIVINNNFSDPKAYQLQTCFCPGGELPCNTCSFGLPSVGGNQSKTESFNYPNNGQCGSIQLDVSPANGEFGACFAWHSTNVACTNPTPIPSATPVPSVTPTPTTVPVAQCQQLEMYRAGTQITPDQIQRGDVITVRGFASAVNTTVSQISFNITKGGTVQAPILVNATLANNLYQAETQITIDTATTYSITTTPVSP